MASHANHVALPCAGRLWPCRGGFLWIFPETNLNTEHVFAVQIPWFDDV